MERTLRPFARGTLRALTLVVTVTVASNLAVAPATAGLRDKLKSAKDRATQKADGKPRDRSAPCDTVTFTDVVLDLASGRIDKVIAGLKAGNSVRGEQGKLVLRRNELSTQISALREQHGEAIAVSQRKRDEAENCFSIAFDGVRKQRWEAEQRKMMANPASAEKMLKLVAAMNDAQLKGDNVAEKKIQAELDVMTGPTRADTLAARQKCGPLPTPHTQAVRLDALEHEAAENDERIRDLDMKARKLQTDASGMTPEQFAMAQERAELYLATLESGSSLACFTAAEREALAAHRDALKEALRG